MHDLRLLVAREGLGFGRERDSLEILLIEVIAFPLRVLIVPLMLSTTEVLVSQLGSRRSRFLVHGRGGREGRRILFKRGWDRGRGEEGVGEVRGGGGQATRARGG